MKVAAPPTWIFRGGGLPLMKVAAAPRPRRGYSVVVGGGGVAAPPRPRRGYSAARRVVRDGRFRRGRGCHFHRVRVVRREERVPQQPQRVRQEPRQLVPPVALEQTLVPREQQRVERVERGEEPIRDARQQRRDRGPARRPQMPREHGVRAARGTDQSRG